MGPEKYKSICVTIPCEELSVTLLLGPSSRPADVTGTIQRTSQLSWVGSHGGTSVSPFEKLTYCLTHRRNVANIR